jgi:hypothetical protein
MIAEKLEEKAKERIGTLLRSLPRNEGFRATYEVRKLLLEQVAPGSSRDEAALCAVREACRGSMLALIIHQAKLTEGAVGLLRAVAEAAFDLRLDPTAALTRALEGIADVQSLIVPEDVTDIRYAVAEEFHGADEALDSLIQARRREPFRFSALGSVK